MGEIKVICRAPVSHARAKSCKVGAEKHSVTGAHINLSLFSYHCFLVELLPEIAQIAWQLLHKRKCQVAIMYFQNLPTFDNAKNN